MALKNIPWNELVMPAINYVTPYSGGTQWGGGGTSGALKPNFKIRDVVDLVILNDLGDLPFNVNQPKSADDCYILILKNID